MTELDQMWSLMLNDAATRAGDAGRPHIAEYLRLKAANDAIREIGVTWLFNTAIAIAAQASGTLPGITIEREEPHRFARGSSTMVGSLVRVRRGVRCLTVEAGWARTPGDGIMAKGALAFARITHFGMPKAGAELCLVYAGPVPLWTDDEGTNIDSNGLGRHFEVLFAN